MRQMYLNDHINKSVNGILFLINNSYSPGNLQGLQGLRIFKHPNFVSKLSHEFTVLSIFLAFSGTVGNGSIKFSSTIVLFD